MLELGEVNRRIEVERFVFDIEVFVTVDLRVPEIAALELRLCEFVITPIALVVIVALPTMIDLVAAVISGVICMCRISGNVAVGCASDFLHSNGLPALHLLLLGKHSMQFFQFDLTSQLQIFARIFSKIPVIKGGE
jgi:hypothetical protein